MGLIWPILLEFIMMFNRDFFWGLHFQGVVNPNWLDIVWFEFLSKSIIEGF